MHSKKEIERIRMKLEALIKQKGTLSDEEIIQYSRKLDILINEYLENENHSHSK